VECETEMIAQELGILLGHYQTWHCSEMWEWRKQIKTACMKKFKSKWNSGNVCYHWVQNLLSSHLLFKNGVLREIFQPRREEVTGEWRKLHNEELYDMYTSLNVIRVVKSGRMKWHVACAIVRGNTDWVLQGETWRNETTWKT